MTIEGNIVDVISGRCFFGTCTVNLGRITEVVEVSPVQEASWIFPGFIDSHVHIESSMVVPSRFAEAAIASGVVAVVSDPHEIANVLGVDGVRYMVSDAAKSDLSFFFGVPSCVPATNFESAGAVINAEQVGKMLKSGEYLFLSEMMNFPGVLFGDTEVASKLKAARNNGLPVDGHAPALVGSELIKYVNAGISTDHEAMTISEARAKILAGMIIQIREGSAAKNFEALHGLLTESPDKVMLCTDDIHPDDLVEGYIDSIIRRALAYGHDLVNVIRAATLTPVKHYNLPVGLLQVGDTADIVIVDNLTDFNVLETYIAGKKVYEKECISVKELPTVELVNKFEAKPISKSDIEVAAESSRIKVIAVDNGELFTHKIESDALIINGKVCSNLHKDILKLVVLNRYQKAKPAVAFIYGFGFQSGAIATTVAHDSHNIIAVGVNDADIVLAVNTIIDAQGGMAIVNNGETKILPLPVAGLMSDKPVNEVAKKYSELNRAAKKLGGNLTAPFMTLSFMSLLVIPKLKLSDKGLFDGESFQFTSLFI